MDREHISAALGEQAKTLGFRLTGICQAIAPAGFSRLEEWLARGYAGEMTYLAERREAYSHPRYVLEGARSLVLLALPYLTAAPRPCPPGFGRVSRYAWGEVDYHDVIRQRLHKLADFLRELVPSAVTRGVVDTAPLLEREFAALAGLGWIGKNTLLLNRQEGSYFFLAALLTDVELAYNANVETDHCGSCTACLDACPTQAFPAPYVLDASRCISYLTIEQRGATPLDLRSGQQDWLFGCDVCQEVCPWNRFSTPSDEPEFAPLDDRNPMDLAQLFALHDESFRARFRHTPLWRPHRRGLLRNAAIVLGNQRHTGALNALIQGLNDVEPLVRGAAAWALGRLESQAAYEALQTRHAIETDSYVREEIAAALSADACDY